MWRREPYGQRDKKIGCDVGDGDPGEPVRVEGSKARGDDVLREHDQQRQTDQYAVKIVDLQQAEVQFQTATFNLFENFRRMVYHDATAKALSVSSLQHSGKTALDL